MNNKLQAKDLINLGLFTVLYFVIGCCVAIPIGFVPIFLPILGALWSLIRAGESVRIRSPNCLKNAGNVICVRHAALFSQTMPVRSH